MMWHSVNIFELVSKTTNLPMDQARAFTCVVCSLILSDVHRTMLHPKKVSSTVRYATSLCIGLLLVSACFGWDVIHLIVSSCVTYILILVIPSNVIHGYVFSWAIFYQSVYHIYSQLMSDGSYVVNVSGPLMILTQKLTYASFSIQKDYIKSNEGNNCGKSSPVKLPTPLEFFSYTFHMSSVFAGPAFDFNEYKQCIGGTHYEASGSAIKNFQEPSPYKMVLQKLLKCIMSFVIFVNAFKVCPIEGLTESDFINNTSIGYKVLYVSCTMVGVRYRYYVAWLLGESAEHLFGIGFNGYSESGSPKWDKNDNVNILGFETALNLKEIIDNWNITSSLWLRRLVYDMTPFYPTVVTLVVSALWHGFHAGYFLTFLTVALALTTARQVRRKIRLHFQTSWVTRYFYNVLTYIVTHAALSYCMVPFIVMTLKDSLAIWRSVYFCGHLVFAATLFVLHFIPRPTTTHSNISSEKISTEKKSD